MSLYTDLSEVLSPYAEAIKDKANLSDVYNKSEVDGAIDDVREDISAENFINNRYFSVFSNNLTGFERYNFEEIESEEYPTGWRSGVYSYDYGEYDATEFFVCTADYLSTEKYVTVKVTPTSNHAVSIALYDANKNFIRTVGHSNTTTHPENINVPVIANVAEASYITITAGRYTSGTASTLANDPDFIARIGYYGGASKETKIDDIEETVSGIETDINALADAVAKEGTENYTATEAEDVISRIRACQTGNSLTFALVTDIHYGSTDKQYGLLDTSCPYMLDHTIKNINYVSKFVHYDFLVNLGDNTDGDLAPSQNKALDDVVNKKLGLLKIPYLFSAGNHDTNIYYNNGSNTRTPSEMYAYGYSMMTRTKSRPGTYGNDWYLDLDELGIRIISLSVNYTYRYRFSGEADLQTWLETVLDSDKINIIFTHLSMISSQNWNGTAPNRAKYPRNAVSAFVENGGTVIQLCGHSHADYSFETPWLCVFSNCTKFFQSDLSISQWEAITGNDELGIVNPERVEGEASEDCWTTVIVNPELGTIDFIRFGAGNDRHYTFDVVNDE